MHISNECGHCAAATRSRRREFSDQIWSVLITWGEVNRSLVDEPICDDCYNEFRETLIDRARELEMALADPVGYKKAYEAEKKAEKAVVRQLVQTSQVKEKPKKKAPSSTTKTATASKAKKKPAPKKKAPAAKKKTTKTKKKVTKPAASKKTTKKTTKKAKKKTKKTRKLAS